MCPKSARRALCAGGGVDVHAGRPGPNLAKGDFSAKYSRAAGKNNEKSVRYTGLNACNDALSGRRVRTMRKLRSFERPGGINFGKSAVKLGQNT
jgi:hypothetical protein